MKQKQIHCLFCAPGKGQCLHRRFRMQLCFGDHLISDPVFHLSDSLGRGNGSCKRFCRRDPAGDGFMASQQDFFWKICRALFRDPYLCLIRKIAAFRNSSAALCKSSKSRSALLLQPARLRQSATARIADRIRFVYFHPLVKIISVPEHNPIIHQSIK